MGILLLVMLVNGVRVVRGIVISWRLNYENQVIIAINKSLIILEDVIFPLQTHSLNIIKSSNNTHHPTDPSLTQYTRNLSQFNAIIQIVKKKVQTQNNKIQ